MFSHGLDPKTGKVINQKHELFGKEVEGKVLVRCKNTHPTGGVMLTCARHDASAEAVEARRYRTEGQRQQGKGIPRDGMSGGSMRQNPCT